ncbi:uncharacterized protein LOC126969464 [Leptidea sinapis]|uniref:uncharacterized protein LOC126969464 n=1 Tax=Leptidea sinapis TaxID=189913 RepID=UPI0021C38429|nr:uncharacterized protein LOC126969464 [Leptidea sinapis]
MAVLWVILLFVSTWVSSVKCLPIGPAPQVYPHDENGLNFEWRSESGLYLLPALALVVAAGLIFGCTWCYRHKDCKQNDGNDNQLFSTSATQLHDARRVECSDAEVALAVEPATASADEHNNNNGPISLREMQNIANNNAGVYIASDNEQRDRSRESVVRFEPLTLPPGRALDPLERCAHWFAGEDFPRNQLQYLREIGRGWFGRVVEGEIEDGASSSTVAVAVLNPTASLEDKARFLDEARVYRDLAHENVLPYLAKCLQEDPWMLMFELCPMSLHQYLEENRANMARLSERGIPLQLMCDMAAGLAHLHSRGFIYKILWSGNVLVRGGDNVRAVIGSYAPTEPTHACPAPETTLHNTYTASSDVWALGCAVWEVCTWGSMPPSPPLQHLPRLPACPYREHLYQVMQLCWHQNPESRPTAAQVNALLDHLHSTYTHTNTNNSHFEERWQTLKPNTIPKLDEHIAIVHAPSITSQFGSDQEFDSAHTVQDTLSVCDTAVSRSSSIMSDRDVSVQNKSDSLNNLHGSFEDVRNIYLTHNEGAALECHQGNVMEDKDEQSDSLVDPWLKEIIAGSQDDVSYFKDVSDVIKNLDNILNSEKTSSSESSHQASPSRDNLTLECKKDYPMQTSLVKSPGISNFQNILEINLVQEICSNNSRDPGTRNNDHDNTPLNIDTVKLGNAREQPDEINIQSLPALNKGLVEINEVKETPQIVQIVNTDKDIHESLTDQINVSNNIPVTVQNALEDLSPDSHLENSIIEDGTTQQNKYDNESDQFLDSTSYMDLTTPTNTVIKNSTDTISYQISINENSGNVFVNESTIYLDLPSVLKEIDTFIHAEKVSSSQDKDFQNNVITSTPLGSKGSDENILEAIENDAADILVDNTKVPDEDMGLTLTKLEQKCVPESLSPFESPSKSHYTDTYDENSSVVLGPFENCSLELYKGLKSSSELVDLPKEELLAFSSNFSEINLETPSPLRDSNFLMEVPDINHDDLQYDDTTTSEPKPPVVESVPTTNTDETEEQSNTERHISPLTPPNSPGNILASSSQPKYLINPENNEFQDVINDIEIQITSKIAMAENENNMNLENSGPLIEEVLDDSMLKDQLQDSYLAGNGGSIEEPLENITINEERMKELRNELELKLPLAQVAGIEPQCGTPPAEICVTYGALSPIAEETGHQLHAYENDDNWNTSIQTDSSESYPDPCNNSTDEVTDLPTGMPTGAAHSIEHSTYTICSNNQSCNQTFTLQKDTTISKEITMSADSLNASPLKKIDEVCSPIDDRTYNKDEEDRQLDNCERLSQVSPFLLSPETDVSAPEISDLNAAHLTLSKSTLPTDAKSSKLSETQCLSKATSIDSWCSNDTLYNVEENFDDLTMDPDLPQHFEQNDIEKSESDNTLTHNEEDKEDSHCSTYIVHDSKSEPCDTFSPDSITANDNYTFTKAKTDVAGTTPSNYTKSDLNDSTKNSQTKDLAYGTLMSGMPSFSNCTTDLGFEDTWKLPQPELIRRSPIGNDFDITLPQQVEEKNITLESPIVQEYVLKKIDSVEVSCLQDASTEHNCSVNEPKDSPDTNFRNMINSVTSTPITDLECTTDTIEAIPCQLPLVENDSGQLSGSLPNFTSFFQSAEIRPQDINSDPKYVLKKIDSREVSCLQDGSTEHNCSVNKPKDSPDTNFRNMVNSVTSTPVTDLEYTTDATEAIPCQLPLVKNDSGEISGNLPNFTSFLHSAEIRPQNLSSDPKYGPQKIDSGEVSCLQNDSTEHNSSSPDTNFKNMVNTVTSTPVTDLECDTDITEAIPFELPLVKNDGGELSGILTNFTSFIQSAEIRPQDMSSYPKYVPKEIDNGEVSCLQDAPTERNCSVNEPKDSPDTNFRNMVNTVTSTPVTDLECTTDITEAIPFQLPLVKNDGGELSGSLPNFTSFLQSAEIRPQDISSDPSRFAVSSENNTGGDRDGRLQANNSNTDSLALSRKTFSYSEFENSVVAKPQDVHSGEKSSQSAESGVCSEDFQNFESSVRDRPQDLSSLLDGSALFIKTEKKMCEHLINTNHSKTTPSQSTSARNAEQPLIINPSISSFRESPALGTTPPSILLSNVYPEDENEQPHSIIVTDSSLLAQPSPKSSSGPLETKLVDKELSGSPKLEAKINGIEFFKETNGLKNIFLESDISEKQNRVTEFDGIDVVADSHEDIKCKGGEVYATVNFLNETFEELMESNVDDLDTSKLEVKNIGSEVLTGIVLDSKVKHPLKMSEDCISLDVNADVGNEEVVDKSATANFLQNEKKFCDFDAFFPLLSDIRFTGPGLELMSTSFTQDSPTEPTSPDSQRESGTDNKSDKAADLLKEWDSDTDSHSTNSSSGEFIWKVMKAGLIATKPKPKTNSSVGVSFQGSAN